MPNTATTYTADAPITIVQKLNNDGSQTKTWTGPTVSQDFYGANDQIPLGQMPLYAKAAYNGNQLLNNGHKQIVAYFGAAKITYMIGQIPIIIPSKAPERVLIMGCLNIKTASAIVIIKPIVHALEAGIPIIPREIINQMIGTNAHKKFIHIVFLI